MDGRENSMCQIVENGFEPETIAALQEDPFGISLLECLLMDTKTKIRKLGGDPEAILAEETQES